MERLLQYISAPLETAVSAKLSESEPPFAVLHVAPAKPKLSPEEFAAVTSKSVRMSDAAGMHGDHSPIKGRRKSSAP
eukprot:5189267-Prymnesium_polylepis.1